VVGSLSQAALRFAGEAGRTQLIGAFEIIALSGTLDATDAPAFIQLFCPRLPG